MTGEELADGWERAWSARHGGDFAAVCSPAIHYEDPLVEAPLVGLAALGEHARRLWAGIPDAHVEPAGARLSDGRFLAAPSRLRGRHSGHWDDLPPSGRRLVVHVVFYCELEHGRLRRVRAFFDAYDAGRQLGLVPSRGTLSERAMLMLRGFGLRLGR